MNLLLSYHINNKETPSTYYSEIELFSSSNHRIDGFIFITTSLISFIKRNIQTSPISKEDLDILKSFIRKVEGKQHLLIDFSNGFFKRGKTNTELVARKIKKYCDYPSSYLVLIGTNWNNSELIKRLPKSIKFKNQNVNTINSALISPKLLGIILGIKGKRYGLLKNVIFNNQKENVKKLLEIHKNLNGIMEIEYYSTEDFNKVKEKNTLIKWL
jgi:sporulation protein YlmC with PRC-barrel domain